MWGAPQVAKCLYFKGFYVSGANEQIGTAEPLAYQASALPTELR